MAHKDNYIESLVSQYIDDELSVEQCEMVDQHVAECESCRNLLTEHQCAEDLIDKYVSARRNHLATDELLEYCDGRTSSAWKRNLIEDHLRACKNCQKLLEATAALEEGEVELPEHGRASSINWQDPLWRILELIRGNRLIPAGFALAAIVVITVVVFTPKPNPYAPLVHMTPAPYLTSEFRGEDDEAWKSFREGMVHYLNKEFTTAG